MQEAVEAAAQALMHGPPDPIRDEFGEGAVTTNPGIAVVGATRALRAVEPFIRKQVEAEVRERLLSDEACLAGAAVLHEKPALSVRITPGRLKGRARRVIEAALDNTPTPEDPK
jgi:hypothetical protein